MRLSVPWVVANKAAGPTRILSRDFIGIEDPMGSSRDRHPTLLPWGEIARRLYFSLLMRPTSWDDKNVSEHPKFYNADIKDELTNIGAFFDRNNQYNGKSSLNSEPLTTDRCYKNKDGNTFCEDYTRLQLIPPSLIKDPQSCYALNSVGMYKDMDLNEDRNDRVMNGGMFFNGVNASHKKNEIYSKPIDSQVGDCAI